MHAKFVDVTVVILDISKALIKVLHKGVLFKSKSYGFEGELPSLLECYLSNREQTVILNGQTSELIKTISHWS